MSTRYDLEYLGDGVYVYHDGFQVWLITERDEGEHRIALEPVVFDNLVRYRKRIMSRSTENPDAGL
jgi:hypothetical protein